MNGKPFDDAAAAVGLNAIIQLPIVTAVSPPVKVILNENEPV